MSYTEAGLPFSGAVPQSRHTSRLGAEDAKGRSVPQVIRYLKALKDRPDRGLTDWEAAELLGVERSTINARRAELVEAGLVVPSGDRPGPTGVRNTVWVAR